MKARKPARSPAVALVFICVLRYEAIGVFLATPFSHSVHAMVYLLSVALRSQDVKLNDVSWDHYLINEPPLKCEGVQK